MLYALYLVGAAFVYRVRGHAGWSPSTQLSRVVWGLYAALPVLIFQDPWAYLAAAAATALGLIATGHGAEQHYEDHLLGDGLPSEMEKRKLRDHGQDWFQENADFLQRLIQGPYNLYWRLKKKKQYKFRQALQIGFWRGAFIALPTFLLGGFTWQGALAFLFIAAVGYAVVLLVKIPGTVNDPFIKGQVFMSPPNRELTVGAVWGGAFIAGALI